MNPKPALIAAFSATLFTLTAATRADSLSRVYELALENDFQFRRAEARYLADGELEAIARAELLPDVKAGYVYRSLEDDTTNRQLVANGDGSFFETDVDLERDVDDMGWRLRLDQPLFDAPAWYDYKEGGARALAAEASFADARQQLVLRVLRAYLDVLRAQDDLAAARAQQRAYATQLAQSEKRFESGLIPITDVTESQSAFDLAAARTIEEETQVEFALEALSNLTGESHSVINILRDDFEAVPPQPDALADWATAARSDNLALLAARHEEEAARFNRRSADWEHSPTLELGLFASSLETDGTVVSNLDTPFVLSPDQTIDTMGIELRLEIPLYQGGGVVAARRRAEHLYQASREQVNFVARRAETAARQAFLGVRRDLARIEARRQAVLSAKAAYDAAEAGYNVGTRNIIDVLNAQNTLFAAERDYAGSRYDYLENSFALRAAAARLRPEDLYRLDAFLTPPSGNQATLRAVR